MKRRILSILTALALCLSLLPTAWAAEPTQTELEDKSGGLTFDYSSNIPKEETVYAAGGGTITWTPQLDGDNLTSGTLTLDGATITSSTSSGIKIPACTTIVLKGNNNITVTNAGSPAISVEDIYVPDIAETLTIQGSGSLSINSVGNGIFAQGDITIKDGANVEIDVSTPYACIYSNFGSISVKDSTVKAKTVGDTGNNYAPLTSVKESVIIENSHVAVINQNGYAIKAAKDIKMTDSDVAAIGNSISSAVGFDWFSDGVHFQVDGGSLYIKNNSTNNGDYDLMYSTAHTSAINGAILFYGGKYFNLIANGNFVQYAACTYDESADKVSSIGNGRVIGSVTWSDKIPFPKASDNKSLTVRSGGQITIPQGTTAVVPAGGYLKLVGNLVNNGKLTLEQGGYIDSDVSVVNNGTLDIAGTFYSNHPSKIQNSGTVNGLEILYNETADSLTVDYLAHGNTVLSKNFSVGSGQTTKSTKQSVTVSAGASLKIPAGVTLDATANGVTVDTLADYYTNNGTLVVEGTAKFPADSDISKLGTITNNGTVILDGNCTAEDVSAYIKSLKLTGDGKVEVTGTTEDGASVTSTYTNSGMKQFPPAGAGGTLDLSKAEAADKLSDQGYKWEVTKDATSGNVTSATLTLAEGFNVETLKLPNTGAISIVTQGEANVKAFTLADSPNVQLTFSGKGPLTVQGHMEISGGNKNSLTVEAGAEVVVKNGISIGASGGVDSTITVNGTLTAAQGNGTSAIYGGKVEIGNTGVLEVSGTHGVQLNGMTDNFSDLFTIEGDGRFTANCSEYNIRVNVSDVSKLPKDESGNADAKQVINLGPEYMPDDCEQRLKDDPKVIDLIRISTDAVYSGPLTIHKNHTWETGWTHNNGDTHWHACEFVGCTEKQPGSEAAHFYRSCVCTVCGYHAPAGTPDSGGGGGGGSVHTHVWETDWTTSETHHWHECTASGCDITVDSGKDGYGTHVYSNDADTTCDTCGYVRTVTPPEPSHTHSWATAWSSDGTHHWHECTAEDCDITADSGKDSYGTHVYDSNQDAECNVCGYLRTVTPPIPPQPSQPSQPSGGGSSVSTTYAITVEKSEHGKVTSNRTTASSGSTITLTVTPDSGYVLDTLTATDSRGSEIRLTAQDSGKYTFTMPSSAVTVKAAFSPLPDDTVKPCDGGVDCPSRGFTDLGTVGTWYHEAVDYVLRNGLMDGYGNGLFGPDDTITRAQFAQILFNKEGKPVVNYLLQYSDIATGAWYTEAIRWAASQGIVGGYENGTFGPDDPITREQLAVMLWRYAGSPAATDKELRFADADKASSYALEALRWAVEEGIISGKGGGILDPTGTATRAETAQMLKNFLENQ